MQVTIEDVNSVKKIIHIEIPEAEITSQLDNAYGEIKKTAKIKGFRPGKAPRQVLERMYNKDVHADVISKVVQTSLFQSIQDKDLKVVGEPNLDTPDLDPKSSYKYSAEVELKPEIGEVDFKGLSLKKTVYKINDEEVDAQVQMLRKNFGKYEKLDEDRPVNDDDYVEIVYEGHNGGMPFEKTKRSENYILKIGAANLSKDFDDQLIGLKAGDVKEFDVEYPADYVDQDFAGNKISYRVELTEIKKHVLPEVDAEFVKKLGPFETVDDLTAEIRKNLENGYEKRTEQELNEQVFEQLIPKIEFEIPEVMIKYELDGIIKEAEQAFAQNNISMEQLGQTREMLETQYKDLAEKQVRRHLILSAITEQEKFELTDDELEAEYKVMSDNFQQPVEAIKEYYKQNPENIEYFKHALLEKKAIKLIIDTSAVEEVEPELEKEEETKESDS